MEEGHRSFTQPGACRSRSLDEVIMERQAIRSILRAIVSRVKDADLEEILEAAKEQTIAGAHLGISSQVKAMDRMHTACSYAIGNMIDHDIDLISQVIREELAND